MLSCQLLEPVSLTAYPEPLRPFLGLTGTGPAPAGGVTAPGRGAQGWGASAEVWLQEQDAQPAAGERQPQEGRGLACEL